jgi:hypothetical protein
MRRVALGMRELVAAMELREALERVELRDDPLDRYDAALRRITAVLYSVGYTRRHRDDN